VTKRRAITKQVGGRVIALAAAAALAGGTVADAASPRPSWVLKLAIHYLPRASNRSQYDTVLTAGRTAWFFGGSNAGGSGKPEVETRTRGRWNASPLPSRLQSRIIGASSTSPGDIWAVTSLGGTVLHWNGSAWAVVPKGRWNSRAQFTGILALSPRNVWVFGARGDKRRGAGTWHRSGTKWTETRGMAGDIAMASATTPFDMWGIGGIGGTMNALLRFKGGKWLHEVPSSLAGFTYSFVLVLGPRDVWVAGSVAGLPELGHYDGSGWGVISMPGFVPATGMCRDGRGGLWVIANLGVGSSSVLHRSAAHKWTSVPVSRTSADEVFACAVVPHSTATWGAGEADAPAGSAAAVYGFGKVP
jgi:hypothetical protein